MGPTEESMGAGSAKLIVVDDPVAWWSEEVKKHAFTGIAFQRGAWCWACKANVALWQSQLSEVKKAGGAFVLATAQKPEAAAEFFSGRNLDVSVLSDPTNSLARMLGAQITSVAFTPELSDTYDEYGQGVAQPAYYFQKQDGTELYSWNTLVSEYNLGGALDRPVPSDVVKHVVAKLGGQLETEVRIDDYADVIKKEEKNMPEFAKKILRKHGRLPPTP